MDTDVQMSEPDPGFENLLEFVRDERGFDYTGYRRPTLIRRFERTALYAHEHGFPVINSSLAISRWKHMNQINGCGERAAFLLRR